MHVFGTLLIIIAPWNGLLSSLVTNASLNGFSVLFLLQMLHGMVCGPLLLLMLHGMVFGPLLVTNAPWNGLWSSPCY